MSGLNSAIYRPLGSSRAFVMEALRTRRRTVIGGTLLTLLLGSLYLISNGNIAVALAPLLFLAIVVVLWHFPEMLLPMTVAGACLFETQILSFRDSLTDRVPLFWDVNTVLQVYAHVNYHGVPFSLFEIIVILGATFSIIRVVYERKMQIKGSVFIGPILAYLACVTFGLLNGLATGGDYHIAMFEVRAQFYILFAYLMAVNTGRDAGAVTRNVLWITAICIGIKGVLLTYRYFVTLGGKTDPDVGVGSHEESFFFNEFVVLYIVLKMAEIEPKLRRVMLVGLPFVVIANLANERRAATAALLVAVPVLMILSYAAFPFRRRAITLITLVGVLVFSVYLPAYWNSDGVLAQPARAIRSHFSPDARDESSDLYRQQEDANLMYTMRSSPIVGYGYGKPIRNIAGMVDLTNIDPLIMYLTHDQILWVWMRIGTIGFLVFWIMIANFLVRSSQLASDMTVDVLGRFVGVFAATTIAMLLLFGLYDLQLSNVRDMLFSSAWVGMVAAILRQKAEQEETERASRLTEIQRRLQPRSLYSPGYAVVRSQSARANDAAGIVRLQSGT